MGPSLTRIEFPSRTAAAGKLFSGITSGYPIHFPTQRIESVMPKPKVIQADADGQKYLQLLSGPPESITMRSGKVVLQPGKTVGKHSTEGNEELLVLLAGEGLFLLSNGDKLEISAGKVLYCPPDTEHDVKNTGSIPLEYIYVVAKTR